MAEKIVTAAELHDSLDMLFARFIFAHPDRHGFLNAPIADLIEWSAEQKRKEECPDG